jgi:glycosyltransferase involved in cell wall biosynthesis
VMKVLIFDEWFPWPLDCGKKIRTYNLLKRLADKHQIIYLAYANMPKEQEGVNEIAKWCYKVVPIEDTRITRWSLPFYFRVFMNMFESVPFSTAYHVNSKFEHVLLREIAKESPDLVQCEWTNLAPYLNRIKNVPTIISSHNIESEIWGRFEMNNTSLLKRIVGRQQTKRIEKLERYWYNKVDCCIAVSDYDRNIIEGYGARAYTVENGVDIDYYTAYRGQCNPGELVFTASFDTFSNQDGAEYFIEKILPDILSFDSSVKLTLVGKNPPKKLYDLAGKYSNVTLTGTIPDVRPFVSSAEVCVVPLRIGGGTRLKILEAFAMNKPVVSTSIGAEGIEIENGNNIVICDDPKEFARKVLMLLHDKEMQLRIAKEGFCFAKMKYDWSLLAEKMDFIWETIKT